MLALVTHSRAGFFLLNALVSAGCLALAVWQTDMAHRPGPAGHPDGPDGRVPELLVLGAHNWDLWTLAPVAAGLAAAARGRTARAGAWFGLAAGIKWWPALLVIPLIVGRWADQPAGPAGLRRRRRTAPAVAAAGTWALVQLPALAVSPAD